MRIVFLATLLVLCVPVIASAQQPGSTSVCLTDVPSGVLLNICTPERGVAAAAAEALSAHIPRMGAVLFLPNLYTSRTQSSQISSERKTFVGSHLKTAST